MINKNAIIFVILVFFFVCIDGSTIRSSSTKRVKCFHPSKPEDMPQEVYEKYRISSKNLTNEGKKDFWQKFQDWWTKAFADVKSFFQKVGKFFKKLFTSDKDQQKQQQQPTTDAPPTPPQSLQESSDGVICIEYDETTIYDNSQTTIKAEINPSKNGIESTPTTTPQFLTTFTTFNNVVNQQTSNKENTFSTPSDPNRETKEPEPVIIGIERKDRRIADNKRDPTIVKAV